MPRSVSRTLGVSPSEVLINSGGEQFLLVNAVNGGTPQCDITFANLPNGTDFAGQTAFTGAPSFTLGVVNYIWFTISTGLLANNTTGFPGTTDEIPLWQITLDGSGNFTSILDKRPWFAAKPASGVSLALSDLTDVSVDEAAAFNGANAPTGANPFATIADVPSALSDLSDVSTDEAAAFNGANAPTGANPFATIADVPAVLSDLSDVSTDEAAAFNGANAPTGANPFATIADIPTPGMSVASILSNPQMSTATLLGTATIPSGASFIKIQTLLTISSGPATSQTNKPIAMGEHIINVGATLAYGAYTDNTDVTTQVVNSYFGVSPSGITLASIAGAHAITISAYSATSVSFTVTTGSQVGAVVVVYYQ